MLNDEVEAKIQNEVIANLMPGKYNLAIEHIVRVLDALHANIPDSKRVSFGVVYTVQELSRYLFSSLTETNVPVYEIASEVFEKSEDFRSKGVALGILSFCGVENYERVLPFFHTRHRHLLGNCGNSLRCSFANL